MNRREFVAAACAFCVACSEDVLAATAKGPVDAGELGAFSKEGIYDALAQSAPYAAARGALPADAAALAYAPPGSPALLDYPFASDGAAVSLAAGPVNAPGVSLPMRIE